MDTIKYLNDRLLRLETTLDSIQQVSNIQELSIKLNEHADIVSNVGGFYESAWLKLIIVISVLGIIIPLLIQYFQKDTLKQVTNFLSSEIKETFSLRISELEKSNQNQIDSLSHSITSEMEIMKSKHDCMTNELEASLFYLQGKQSYSKKLYKSALRDFKRSAEFWLKSSKPERIGVILSLLNSCIIALNYKVAFEKALSENDIDWNDFMKKINNSGLHSDKLKSIRASISKLVSQ